MLTQQLPVRYLAIFYPQSIMKVDLHELCNVTNAKMTHLSTHNTKLTKPKKYTCKVGTGSYKREGNVYGNKNNL
jgi:hypothetical protein